MNNTTLLPEDPSMGKNNLSAESEKLFSFLPSIRTEKFIIAINCLLEKEASPLGNQKPPVSPKGRFDVEPHNRPVRSEVKAGDRTMLKAKAKPAAKTKANRTVTLFLGNREEYTKFTPYNPDKQKMFLLSASIHRKFMETLLKKEHENWDQFFTNTFSEAEREKAERFYRFLSSEGRKRRQVIMPKNFANRLITDTSLYLRLLEFITDVSDNRDLIKLNESADLIRKYNGPEKTYSFLCTLAQNTELDNASVFNESIGYKTLIKWGATQFLRDFWDKFQRRFRITRTAIKSEAAQNLARELGETESDFKDQIEILKEENRYLEFLIEETKTNAKKNSIIELARNLQDRPAPTLTQTYSLYKKIKNMYEKNASEMSPDLFSSLIVIEDLLESFKSIEIDIYPEYTGEVFDITTKDFNEYQYVKGTPFSAENQHKTVKCIKQGWRACGEIITKAQVEEV